MNDFAVSSVSSQQLSPQWGSRLRGSLCLEKNCSAAVWFLSCTNGRLESADVGLRVNGSFKSNCYFPYVKHCGSIVMVFYTDDTWVCLRCDFFFYSSMVVSITLKHFHRLNQYCVINPIRDHLGSAVVLFRCLGIEAPSPTVVSNTQSLCAIWGYEKVQGDAADCWQQPRHDSQKKPNPSVVEEYGGGVEGTSQRAQQSREHVGPGQHPSSALKGKREMSFL